MKEKEGIISRDAEKHLEKLNTYLNNSQQTRKKCEVPYCYSVHLQKIYRMMVT